MISLSDVASLKNVAMLLVVPIFTYAAMVDPTFVELPIVGRYLNIQHAPDLWGGIRRCFILVGLVGGLMFLVTRLMLALERDLERVLQIKLHWTDRYMATIRRKMGHL